MAPKRRASEDASPPLKERRSEFHRTDLPAALRELNEEFASWVSRNKDCCVHLLWVEGVLDYVQHASNCLDEHQDGLSADDLSELRKAASDARNEVRHIDGRLASVKVSAISKEQRAADFTCEVAALNRGFAKWVASALQTSPHTSWVQAARDYVRLAYLKMEDVADLLDSSDPPQNEESTAAVAGAGTGAVSDQAPVTSGFGAFGGFGVAAGASSNDLVGASTFQSLPTDGKGPAPANGFMALTQAAKPPTTSTTAMSAGTSAAAVLDSSLSGSLTAGTATNSTCALTLSFGATASTMPAAETAGATTDAGAPAAAPSTSFNFGALTSSTAPAASSAAAASSAIGGVFSFCKGSGTDAASETSNFQLSSISGGTGIDGGAKPPMFSFGAASVISSSAAGFMAGCSVNPPAGNARADGECEDTEPEPDECAKEPSLKVDDNVDYLFREKARLQLPVKGPDGKVASWEAKGIGMLSIRRSKTKVSKPYIALFTDAGRCLYQASLYKTMKVVVSDKQKSVAFSAMWSPDGTSPPAMDPALFQLAAGKNRIFEKVIRELQEEMAE